MIIIGLTGGIASGKSTVSKKLARLGAAIIDADCIAREIVEPGQTAWAQIVAYFGKDILLQDGTIDRKKLGRHIFSDAEKRHKLEEITHPEIRTRIRRELAVAREAGRAVAVLDIPLLIEAGWMDMVQQLWLVYIERDIQLERLMRRDNLTAQEAEQRLAAQMSLEDKRKFADVIIDNGGPPEDTEAQIMKAWEELLHAYNSLDCP